MNGKHRRQRRQSFTLERAILLALVLHLLFGALVTWWPGLLVPAEVAAQPQDQPLEFTFVDTPDPVPPEQPPDTERLSDLDRLAADASPRDDQEQPYSEGNTPEQVLRPAQMPAPEQLAQAVAEQPPVDPAESARQPTEETSKEPRPEQPAEARPEAVPETADTRPSTPPVQPRSRALRNSLARLESMVEPQVYDNRSGGAPDSKSLAQFDTRGYDLGAYLRQVLAKIERNWRANIPPLIRTGVGGATFVNLSIRRRHLDDGTEVAVLVAERTWSSGQPAYDSAALFSLELSTPLPAIPDYYPYETIDGRLGYIYNLDPAQIDFPDQ